MHREAERAERLIAELGLEKVHVYGHSDGASIALLLAVRRPSLVVSLTLEAPHVFVEQMCTNQIAKFGREIAATDTIARLGRYHRDAAAVFRQWHDIWTSPVFAGWSIETDISGLAQPALLIQGEDDQYGTMAQLDRIAQLLPDTSQLRLSACGHSPHRDKTRSVIAAVAAFLGERA
jgi:pimeloyl-ACP methyl ester carboxylesterase